MKSITNSKKLIVSLSLRNLRGKEGGLIKFISVILAIAGMNCYALSWDLAGFCQWWLYEGECEYDVYQDGRVNFYDYAILVNRDFDINLVANIDFVDKKNRVNGDALSFVRNSVAYERDGTERLANVLRTDTIPIASPVEYTEVTDYKVVAIDADYVYARLTADGSKLYRSRGAGYGWHHFKTFAQSVISAFVTSQGTLLVALNYSDDAGTIQRLSNGTWTEVLDKTVMTPGANVSFGWTELDGKIFIAEYGSIVAPNCGRKVLLSEDDGETWTVIHNPAAVDDKHAHEIVACYVDGQLRVYITYGDNNVTVRCVTMYYLTQPNDGGTTWVETEVTLNLATQPTSGFWLPEDNAIIWGTDGNPFPQGLIKHDLSDDSMPFMLHTEWYSTDNVNHAYNWLSIKKFSGLYVAGAANQTGDVHTHSGVWISRDCIHWALAVRYWDVAWSGLYIIGIDPQGYLWVGLTTQGSLYFKLPESFYVKGALIERAGDQRCNVAPTAEAGTTVDNAYATDKWVGATCSRWTTDAAVTAIKYLNYGYVGVPDLAVGDLLTVSFWVKGTFGDGSGNNLGRYYKCRCRCLARTSSNEDEGGTRDSIYQNFFVTASWQRITVPVVVTKIHQAGNSQARMYLYGQAAAAPQDAEWDILIDGVTWEKNICPAEWHAVGTARVAEVLSYDPASFPAGDPPKFTDIFTVATRFGDFDMAAPSSGDGLSYIYLRSYVEDDNNFFAVVYDVNDKTIKLIDEVEGSSAVVLALMDATYLFYDEPITIGVTRSGTTVNLYVWSGGIYQTDSGTLNGTFTIDRSYWGCHPAGTQGGSLVFLRSKMWNSVLSDIKMELQ